MSKGAITRKSQYVLTRISVFVFSYKVIMNFQCPRRECNFAANNTSYIDYIYLCLKFFLANVALYMHLLFCSQVKFNRGKPNN